ncbi:UNVERIFIED_ORG: WD40 repeat protein [Microbispora rosea subsp. rosea]
MNMTVTTEGGQGPERGRSRHINAIAYSRRGDFVAIARNDYVEVWATNTGGPSVSLDTPDPVYALAFNPAGSVLVAGDGAGIIRAWSTNTFSELSTNAFHSGRILSLTFNPAGTVLYSGGVGGLVGRWEGEDLVGQSIPLVAGRTGTIHSLALSVDGNYLLSAGEEGVLVVWDVTAKTHKPINAIQYPGGAILDAAFSPDNAIAIAGRTGDLLLWNGDSVKAMRGHQGTVYALAFSSDGRWLASGGADGTLRIWDAAKHTLVKVCTGHKKWIRGLRFSPRGDHIVSGGADGIVRIWDASREWEEQEFRAYLNRRRRPLAGLGSDSPSAIDLLDVSADVETLADLVAARDTQPPLAIALVGEWGAGKSSVMLQIQKYVARLAEVSREDPEGSAFASNIQQIDFNAWHYSDDHIWTGLVDHLFRSLANTSSTTQSADAVVELELTRNELRAEIVDKESELNELKRNLAIGAYSAKGDLKWIGSPLPILQSLWYRLRLIFRDARTSWRIMATWSFLAIASYFVWVRWGALASATLVSVTSALAALNQNINIGSLKQVFAAHAALLEFSEEQKKNLEERQKELEGEIAELKEKLPSIDAAYRLSTFLTQRSEESAYSRYRGLLGQVHRDLQQLSDDLREARAQWKADGEQGIPPLERIILYIDDLDRCPPQRVMEVLGAVHLMLGLPLFIVVVAVDPRWLLRSLEHHYRDVFDADPTSRAAEASDISAPIDYLDKIFQIPYAIKGMDAQVSASYLRALMPLEKDEQPPDESSANKLHSFPSGDPVSVGDLLTVGSAPEFSDDQLGGVVSSDMRAALERASNSSSAQQSVLVVGRAPVHTTLNLQPPGLRLQPNEVDFLAQLAPLVPGPRAAKKLVNLYRLVRISVPERKLSRFVGDGGDYQAVQILLAILVGFPAKAGGIFQAMLAYAGEDIHLVQLLSEVTWPQGLEKEMQATMRLVRELMEHNEKVVAPISTLRQWIPDVARFSFHTQNRFRR